MQKGHLRSPVLVLLTAIIVLCLLCTGVFAKRTERAVGPLLPMSVLSLAGSSDRPFVGPTLPPLPGLMQPQQSGPDPDIDLTPTGSATQELYPSASPGAAQNRIAFCSNGVDADANGQIDPVLPVPADLDIWIMRSDGSEQYRLADLAGDQVDPVYDPSGNILAFAQQVSGVYQIFTIQVLNPAVITQITTGAGNKRHPTFSPDTNWIAFQTDVNGTWDLYRIAATGIGSILPITTGAANDTDPAWAPEPAIDLIAFTRDNGANKRIFTVEPDGTNATAISNGGGSAAVNDKEPAWRWDASELAFASTRFTGVGDVVANYNIWRMAALGEVMAAPVFLASDTDATHTSDTIDPAWTVNIPRQPTRLAFTSFRAGGQADIWSMQLADWIPPGLTDLPTVTPRLAIPGSDVAVSVPVYDQDTGVAMVVAYFKDPDLKTFLTNPAASFDASYSGAGMVRELERDCVIVGSTVLTDPDDNGVFDGTWTTIPSARDYIVDIQVWDVWGNTLIYDDVYGFSTKTFAPRTNILFVDDYCEGQMFLSDLGINNHFPAGWPVESYYTRNPGEASSVAGSVDHDTITDSYGEGYDVWRIICRGPVPQSVYEYYLPTIEYQIEPADADNPDGIQLPNTRAVLVAQRAAIWASPHTGDVWTARGSLVDAATQADIASFVRRGGRIMIAGEDIAWALTLGGTRTNTFMTDTLHAMYRSDIAATSFGIGGRPGDPVAQNPWGGGWHDYGWHTEDTPLAMHSTYVYNRPTSSPRYEDAAEFSVRPDGITVLAPAITIFSINSGEATTFSEGNACGLRWEDTTGNLGKVVFLSFGFEQIHRTYHVASGSIPAHCANHRSHLVHNAMCWERTGGFQGRVISVSDGGQPVNNPAPVVSALQGGQVLYAVQCQQDGTYIMQGLPTGTYELRCARPGYEVQHSDGNTTHGGLTIPVNDFVIFRAQPGAVTGTVTAANGGAPLANVEMTIAPAPSFPGTPPGSLPGPVYTAADGTYTLPYVPPGPYVVTADGSAILYSTETQDVTVPPGDTVVADFQLDAAPGTLAATVTDIDTAAPIQNAAVTAVATPGGQTTVGYTDAGGTVNLSLPPGNYDVTASAPGYQTSAPQNVSITPAATVNVAFQLQHEPGGRIVGRVTSASNGGFLGGVTVRVFFGAVEIASAVTSASVVTTVGGVQYNYEILDVDTGLVRVEASRPGFTPNPASRTVQVLSGQTTRDVNFSMDSLRTFPTGLQLISLPWDFSGIDPKVLLGIPPTSPFPMATWEASMQRYRIYPEAPADRFRLGTGYWMNLPLPADLSQEGLAATDPSQFPLGQGWNLVGCPYTVPIDFYTAQVRDPSMVVWTLQQAMSQGIIGSGLYAYVLGGYQPVGVLSPYIGYWLKANIPCTLILSKAAGALSVGAAAHSGAPQVPNGWLMQLKTKAAGVQDTATYVGAAGGATAGCDFALDQFKPPVPAMGPYVYTAIDNRGWSQNAGDYAVDVRAAGQTATWDLTVYSNLVGEPVTISWDDLSALPRGLRPMLTDLDGGRQVYMRTSLGYSFEAGSSPRRLQVTVSPEGIGQLAITSQSAVPTATGVAISYALSRPASVDVTITNIAGRPIRQLSSSASQAAGLNTMMWDGRDRSGLAVPSGRYLVTIRARTETGQESRAVLSVDKRTR